MTTSEYAKKIAALIDARPRRIDFDKLFYEINARVKVAESRRNRQQERLVTTSQMRDDLWKSIALNDSRQKKASTITAALYAQKLVELINARPRHINLNKLLYLIHFHAEIAESERDIQEGRWSTHEQAMEEMWKLIYSKFNGPAVQKRNSRKLSRKLHKTRP